MDLSPFTTDIKIVGDYDTEELPLFKTFAWDFEHNRLIIENSEFKVVEGKEAVKVWIYQALQVNRYEHEIYSWQYGSEIINLVGQRYSRGLTESEAYRYIKETLLINPYILSVEKKEISFEKDILHVKINVKTVYGEVVVNV